MTTSIRLPIETEQRLNHLAERTLERIRQGGEEPLSHEAFWHEVAG